MITATCRHRPQAPLAPLMKLTRRSAGLLILLYMTLAGVWTWKLYPVIPRVESHQTGQEAQEKVAAYLAAALKGDAVPVVMRLVALPEAHLNALSSWVDASPLNQMRQITVQDAPVSALGQEWADVLLRCWLAGAVPVDLVDVHLMLAAAGDRLSNAARREALQSLARRALAQGDAADAVVILGRANELPGATWETLQQLTAASRAARNTGPALRALSVWINRHKGPETDPHLEEARDLEVSLMMEGSLTSEALSLQLSHLTGAAPYPEQILDRACLTARRARQGSRMIPVLERHLQTFPEHGLSSAKLWLQIDLDPSYVRWLSTLAAICDEEQPGPEAFSAYLRLAAARSPVALPRLCALAATPAMKARLETALGQALDLPETQITVLQLAQSDAVARKVLAARLREAPRNRDLHFAATLAAAAAPGTTSAAMLWQDFLRRFPEDVAARRRLIHAHLQEQQPALALRAYAEIPAKSRTEEDHRQQDILKQL